MVGPDKILEKLVYVHANMVKDNLLSRPEHWPGVRTGPRDAGTWFRAQRPGIFFRQEGRGCLPETAEFQITPAPGFEHLSLEAYCDLVEGAVEAELARLRAARRATGRKVMGLRALMAQRESQSAGSTFPARDLDPRLAGGADDPETAPRKLALTKWRADYREGWRLWAAGDHGAPFPAGTYWMRVAHGAVIRDGPLAAAA